MDLPRIREFFARLEVAFPEKAEAYKDFAEQQNDNWEETLISFQKVRKEWSRESLRLDALTSSKEPSPKAIAAQLLVERKFYAEFKRSEVTMLQARGREEVSRVLKEASEGDDQAQRFLARQLFIAELYVPHNSNRRDQ